MISLHDLRSEGVRGPFYPGEKESLAYFYPGKKGWLSIRMRDYEQEGIAELHLRLALRD